MLKDLDKSDWLSMLEIPEDLVPKALVLRGTRNLKAQAAAHRSLFQNVVEVGSPNGVLEDVFIGSVVGVPVGYASVYGAPVASEVTHLFGVLGTSLVIQTGCCGALGDGIAAGDLVCAIWATCGEGASQYYVGGADHVDASSDLLARIRALEPRKGIGLHLGPIYTTSALFAEGEAEVARWHAEGHIAVDMETAATFAVATHFRMKRLSILFAFDNPREGSHILMEEPEKDERRKMGEGEMIRLALKVAAEHSRATEG